MVYDYRREIPPVEFVYLLCFRPLVFRNLRIWPICSILYRAVALSH